MKDSNKFSKDRFNVKRITAKDCKNIEHSFATMLLTELPNFDFITVDKIRNLNKLPEKNQAVFVMTTSNINSCEILPIIDKKYKIKKAYASYNVINDTGFNELKQYPFETIIMHSHDYKDVFVSLENKNKEIARQVKKYPQHTKLFIFECENDNYISVNSSTNPSISSGNESYILYNSKEKFDFYLNFFDEQNSKKQEVILPKASQTVSYLNIDKTCVKDLFKKIAETETIKELSFIQFTEGLNALNIVENYDIEKINFYFSNRVPSMNKATFKKAKELVKGDLLFKKSTHCKITLIKTDQNFYILVSTANWFTNKKYELHEIFNSEELYDNILNFAKTYFK